jgi:predicted nucleic acid-binding protein
VTRVYADSVFYIALIHPQDPLWRPARQLSLATSRDDIITSDPVITEVLNYFCGRSTYLRSLANQFAHTLRADPLTTIVRQTPELFDAGLKLYAERPDKGYSHTDCMSMAVCAQQGIERVLTHDRHFAQEGLEILL